MKYKYTIDAIQDIAVDAVVVFVPVLEKTSDSVLEKIDHLSGGAFSSLVKAGDFNGNESETVVICKPAGFQAGRLILVGLGDKKKIVADSFRRVIGTISREKAVKNSKKIALCFKGYEKPSFYQAAVEGYFLGSYKMLDFKTGEAQKNNAKVEEITFIISHKKGLGQLEKAVKKGEVIAEGQLLVRQLGYTPANILTPEKYAQKAMELARKYRINCRVLDEKNIAREKMGALIAVGKGSKEKPRFIVLSYKGRTDSQNPVVLVGKGITFDAGGISLKPALNMHEMKNDMAGSAVVLATIITAARLKFPRNLVALMPLAENLPSSTATKPGDIITTRKGLTVEVINTDAEGRLILADALDYAGTFKPQAVIDIATLTGAALYVLGYEGAPILGNNKRLLDQIKSAAENTAEKVWELPIWDGHREMMKSNLADLVNSAGKTAGTIAASAFLENFTGNWPWAHIDIAYMDMEPKGRPYLPAGVTGYGLRLLTSLLENWKKP
ncbi:MAG: leucyl aminopeptidase [candidate division Zixibacteria bacterium]|nr:leucyl aminopeptidase [candidate division Zixibacteria bacterium]